MGGPTEPYKGEERDIEAMKLEDKSVMQVENAPSEVLNKPAMEVVDQFGAHRKTDPREIKLVRKLDLFMLPMLWVMCTLFPGDGWQFLGANRLLYFLNYLDRNAMINGKLDTLTEDLNLQGYQYNTCVSILFVGYLGGQVPSNMLLNRVRPSIFMAGFMLAWSVVSLLTYKAHNYHTMLACRLLLGVTESPFYPGALYVMSMFYTRKEIGTRMAIFYTGSMAASALAGLISAPIFTNLGGKMDLSGWQWVFIIQGAASIFVSLLAFFVLPDSPLKTWWLTEEQRQLAHNRIAMDITERREGHTSVWTGLKEACLDPLVWIFCLMDNLHISTNSFKNFMPTIVQQLGLGTTQALALTCPPYVLASIVAIASGWNSGRMNERLWHITVSKVAAVVGFVICMASLQTWVRYTGVMIFVGASYGVNTIILGWAASVLGQSDEKKAVALAMCNTFGNLSAVYTPYLWPDSDAPRFIIAMSSSIGFSASVILCAWVLAFLLRRRNKKMLAEDPSTTNFYVY